MALLNAHPALAAGSAVAPRRALPAAAALIAFGGALHWLLATSAGLSPDEAHYALYGARPDWSYFDHPPLVGWLQAPFAASGGGDLAMRLVPMACWMLSTALTAALCRSLPLAPDSPSRPGPSTATWAALLMLLTPLLNLLGVALVPDSVLMVLVPAVMAATWKLRDPASLDRPREWAGLGVLLGLSVLAKYTGALVVLGCLVSLLRLHGWRLFARSAPWWTVAIVAAMATPVVAWNARHHWISFAFQTSHTMGYASWKLPCVARAVALQLLLYGLLIPAAGWRALRGAVDDTSAQRDARRLCLDFGLPLLAIFVVAAGRGASLPHWTACAWVALVPLAASGLQRLPRAAIRAMAAWQATLLVVIVGLLLTGGPWAETGAATNSAAGVRIGGARPTPLADVVGWEAAAAHAASLVAEQHARGIVVMNWSLASRLGWYARPSPVFVVPERDDQFKLWYGSLQPGDSAIVVDWSGMPLQPPTGVPGFRACRPLGAVAAMKGDRQLAHFNYLHCTGWRAVAND